MVKYLLATDAVSEPARRHPSPPFMALLREHAGDVAISVISVAEIVYGARCVTGGERYLEYLTRAVLPNVPVIDVDIAVATRYGELRARLERSGTPLADLDLLIAATALGRGMTLVTGNRKHFERINGLALAGWLDRRAEV
ncbi:MAG: type II toxin-antitoxin system VapC family toxin [Deltaproteobacteria bacterium]|nr:type II toxin-antitoxin system VapC family toxin [Deltaproteobacteria bacterium]